MAYVRVHDTSQSARGRVVKRYEVVYRAKVRTEDGRIVTRLRQETQPTKAAAEARAAELNAKKHRRAIDPAEQRARGNRTFDEWASDWLDSQRMRVSTGALKSDTVDDYGKLLDRYVLPELGAERINDIDVMMVDRFMMHVAARKNRQGNAIHPKTVKHAWHVLSRVFEYAARKEALEVNPIPKTDYHDNHQRGKKSAHNVERFQHHPLTTDQVGALCAALRGEYPGANGQPLPAYPVYALMVEFMASTGLRAAEVSGLEIADIKFAPHLAGKPISASVRVDRTKERQGGRWVTKPPKSARSRRTVPLPGWLAAKLADYLATEHPRAIEPDAPLWPSRKNGGGYRAKGARYSVPLDWSQPLHTGTFLDTVFKPALIAVGLPVSREAKPARKRDDGTIELATEAVAGIRLHDMRHTAAHTWLSLGRDIRLVSEWLGHADYTVTLMVYSDLIDGEAAASENPAPEPKSVSNVRSLPDRTG